MSELKVNKISPRSGTDVTLGDSGDTITIASGATFSATITAPIIDEINDTNGNEEIIFTTTASAVNELTIANAATGTAPEIAATGDDTNIDLRLNTKGTGGVVFNAGAVATPSITTTGDTNTGIFFPAADTIAFTEGGTEAMRITSDGNVGINQDTPSTKLEIKTLQTNDSGLTLTADGTSYGWSPNIFFRTRLTLGGSIGVAGRIQSLLTENAGAALLFYTVNSSTNAERMRIDTTGNVLVGKTSTSGSVAGINLVSNGTGEFIRNAERSLFINRLTNDGTLVQFAQDTIDEGSISVSGGTVSYNGFTGTHWSRFIDESKPNVLRGTVLESLDQMTDWYHAEFETSYTEKDADGNDVVKTTTQKKPYALKDNEQEGDVITYAWNTEKQDEEGNDIIEQVQATIVKQKDVKHVMSKISDTVEAKNVYGVFSAWDNDDLINNDFYVASVGSFVVRIKAGQVVSKGDLLQSNGDGTAKVQADDMIRASIFAKVLSNTVIETYEDGSFIVPCSLMC
jgi:hypothetical protein